MGVAPSTKCTETTQFFVPQGVRSCSTLWTGRAAYTSSARSSIPRVSGTIGIMSQWTWSMLSYMGMTGNTKKACAKTSEVVARVAGGPPRIGRSRESVDEPAPGPDSVSQPRQHLVPPIQPRIPPERACIGPSSFGTTIRKRPRRPQRAERRGRRIRSHGEGPRSIKRDRLSHTLVGPRPMLLEIRILGPCGPVPPMSCELLLFTLQGRFAVSPSHNGRGIRLWAGRAHDPMGLQCRAGLCERERGRLKLQPKVPFHKAACGIPWLAARDSRGGGVASRHYSPDNACAIELSEPKSCSCHGSRRRERSQAGGDTVWPAPCMSSPHIEEMRRGISAHCIRCVMQQIGEPSIAP